MDSKWTQLPRDMIEYAALHGSLSRKLAERLVESTFKETYTGHLRPPSSLPTGQEVEIVSGLAVVVTTVVDFVGSDGNQKRWGCETLG